MKMKTLPVIIFLAFLAAVLAQASKEVPVADEPRHRVTFEDGVIRVFRVEVAPHDKTLLHRHERDYFYISIGAADIVNSVLGRPEVSAHLADEQIGFARGGFAHIAENRGDTPFRNFTIEFKRPQTQLTNRCARIDPAQPANCPNLAQDASSATPEFETEDVIVTLLKIRPGARLLLPDPQLAHLLMPLDKVDAQLLGDGTKPRKFKTGKELWSTGAARLQVVNQGASLARFFSIAIKAK